MQLLIFFSDLDVFLTGSKALDLVHVQCFGVGRWIRHKDCTLALAFEESHWEEADRESG
jgi:hypothetical protein